MKKLISLFLVLCMAIPFFTFAVPANATTYGYLLGDADDSTQINMKDILLTRRYVAGLVTEKDINMTAADTDKSGSVNLRDVLLVRKHVAGTQYLENVNDDDKYKVSTVSIANRNISRFTVVIPENSVLGVQNAAKEFVKYINSACGYTLGISTDKKAVSGYAIEFKTDDENYFDLGDEGFKTTVEENGNLSFTYNGPRGAFYAVYTFLEDFIGWRFLFDNVTYLYEADNINVDEGYDNIEVPVLEYRTASQSGITQENFVQLKSNASDGAVYCSPFDRYGGAHGTLWEHAHSYAAFVYPFEETNKNIPSEAWLTQPCLTSEDTFEGAISYLSQLLENRINSWGRVLGSDFDMISCSPNDNTDFCKCTECKAIYDIEGSIAGTVFRFSNRVCEDLLPGYPGLKVYTVAYWDARNPPKMTRPSDDIVVCFCIGGCNNHTYDNVQECIDCGGNPRLQSPSGENQNNNEEMRYLKQWAELTNNLWIWYYSANFGYHAAPAPNLFNIYNDFKYLAAIGVTGIYSEGSNSGKYSFEFLRGYMASKMMWDPFMSEEEFNALFNEYLMIYYGKGWENIREYIEMTDYCSDLQGCWTNNFDRPWNMYNKEYFRDNYETMHQLFAAAYEAAETEAQKIRVERTSLHCEFLGLSATYERDYVNGSTEAKAEYTARYKKMYDLYNHYDMEIGPFSDEHGCQNYPKNANDVRDPVTWIIDDFTGQWEWDPKSNRYI